MGVPAGEHAEDLAWAQALGSGQRDALARYEREIVPVIQAQLARRAYTSDEIAELQQTLRVRLFAGPDAAIASYAGRGTLKSWVLVGATREAIRLRAKRRREPAFADDALIDHVDRGAMPPELDRDRCREVFRAAFREALGELGSRGRNLLRLSALDGLAIDEIGALLGVHRATAARWLTRAREDLALGVRKAVQRHLGADPFEAQSLLRWVDSQLDLSFTALAPSTQKSP